MIEYPVLTKLTLKALLREPNTQVNNVYHVVERIAEEQGLFPSREECIAAGVAPRYYEEKKLNPTDILNVNQILWDFVCGRIITPGSDALNIKWPFLRLTDYGKEVATDNKFSYFNVNEFIGTLKSAVPDADDVIIQYLSEAYSCFRQKLFFGCAVMCGAAAEKSILLLLNSIAFSEEDPIKKRKMDGLLERATLPKVFQTVSETIESLIADKKIPYKVHEGVIPHLLSIYEMIRVHRNEAVHPVFANVSKNKALLTLQSFPGALEVNYRLMRWFKDRKSSN